MGSIASHYSSVGITADKGVPTTAYCLSRLVTGNWIPTAMYRQVTGVKKTKNHDIYFSGFCVNRDLIFVFKFLSFYRAF